MTIILKTKSSDNNLTYVQLVRITVRSSAEKCKITSEMKPQGPDQHSYENAASGNEQINADQLPWYLGLKEMHLHYRLLPWQTQTSADGT